MGATFGATGDMNGDAVAGRRQVVRELCRNRAGLDQSGCACWSAGASNNAAARVARIHHKA